MRIPGPPECSPAAHAEPCGSGFGDICGCHVIGPDGTVLKINDTELVWLGYYRGEVVERMRFDQLIAPHCLALFHDSFARLKRTGWLEDLEFDLKCRDGSLLPVLVNSKAIRAGDGSFLACRSVVLDNRERNQRKVEIAALKAELERRARTAEAAAQAKNVFLAALSREIQAPAKAILDHIRMAQRLAADPCQREQLAKARTTAEQLIRVIDGILDLSGIAPDCETRTGPAVAVPADEKAMIPGVEDLATRLQAIPGIDLGRGPNSAGGDPIAYLRILRHLFEYHRDDPDVLRDCLAHKNAKQASLRLKSLKDSSAVLGLSGLHQHAVALETAIAQARPSDEIEDCRSALESELKRLHQAILELPAASDRQAA